MNTENLGDRRFEWNARANLRRSLRKANLRMITPALRRAKIRFAERDRSEA
ncbi:MAG TPA: hypothetical protein VFA51_11485 [Candidatus Udaeobacter sp.]|nr:hypothetical protein [Candidatus Udaeobacter sp.]